MSSSLSDNTGAVGFRDGLETVGRGVVVSWQCSVVKGRISSYKYHCRFASSPLDTMICGIVRLLGNFRFAVCELLHAHV